MKTRRPRAASGNAASHSVMRHNVVCPYCRNPFDVFTADWCTDPLDEPSKICPHCGRCLCQHPAYQEPHFWKEAPLAFQRQGFQRLFLFYL